MSVGKSIVFEKGVFQSTEAINDNLVVIELETPNNKNKIILEEEIDVMKLMIDKRQKFF